MFKPQGNYIAAKLIEQEEKTPAGIIIPDKAKERPQFAEVIGVGEGIRSALTENLIPIPIRVGDKVVVERYAYRNLKLPDGEEIIIFSYGDILGTLED